MIKMTASIELSPQYYYLVDMHNLLSMSAPISRVSNPISFGLYSTKGQMSFTDYDNTIKSMIENQIITSNTTKSVTVYLVNTKNGIKKSLGSFIAGDWEYGANNRTVRISLSDGLLEWQNISNEGFSYDYFNPRYLLPNSSCADLYKWLHGQTPEKDNMISYDDLDSKTKEILESTRIAYPFLYEGTLWEQWQKLCDVCMLYIYKLSSGQTTCKYAFGE